MTIDEHIHKAEEDAKMAEIEARWGMGSYFIDRTEALEHAKECRQLAEWLKDYKRLLEQDPCDTCEYEEGSIYCKERCPNEAKIDQEPCEMTAEEYRQRMIQAFHNADTDELIAVCVLPTEKEFEHLEWLLKNHYKNEPCSDAIDRSKAIMIASGYCHPANVAKELAKLPPVNPQPCEDAISRQAVLDMATTIQTDDYSGNEIIEVVDVDDVKALPPVTPQPKEGHWITDAKTYYEELNKRGLGVDEYTPYFTDDIACSECLAKYSMLDNETQFFKHCPNCGAKMSES